MDKGLVRDWDTGKQLDPLVELCYANFATDGTLVFFAPKVSDSDVKILRGTRRLA